MVPPLRFADFCCGMGSFHKSFIELGWMCVAAADIDEAATATYEHHFGIKPHGDIRDIKPDMTVFLTTMSFALASRANLSATLASVKVFKAPRATCSMPL